MKSFTIIFFLLFSNLCISQSVISDPETGCKFTLPWTCDECTIDWTGDCEYGLVSGKGVLTTFNGENEIMRYEGRMENGKFNGFGSYRDGMNQMEGTFENGSYVNTNPYLQNRKKIIDTTRFNKTDDWETKTQVTKQVDNLYFTFPADGYAYENRDELVQQCLDAVNKNCELIHDPSYTEFTRVRFVKSKNEVLLHANLFVRAMADIQTRSVHIAVNNDDETPEAKRVINLPITHEIMHMVSMTAWGKPPSNLNWLNEGLATYANNNCSGYSVAEIYRYFLAKDMLAPIASLTTDFYQTEEMISYHQSAYIAEYLITNYGIDKLETLWKSGFSSFEDIYGRTSSQMQEEINEQIVAAYPEVPAIDWEVLSKGCD